jgi:hypothetical protein
MHSEVMNWLTRAVFPTPCDPIMATLYVKTSGAGSASTGPGLAGGVPSGADGDVRTWGGTRLLLRERRLRNESPRFTTPAIEMSLQDVQQQVDPAVHNVEFLCQ